MDGDIVSYIMSHCVDHLYLCETPQLRMMTANHRVRTSGNRIEPVEPVLNYKSKITVRMFLLKIQLLIEPFNDDLATREW